MKLQLHVLLSDFTAEWSSTIYSNCSDFLPPHQFPFKIATYKYNIIITHSNILLPGFEYLDLSISECSLLWHMYGCVGEIIAFMYTLLELSLIPKVITLCRRVYGLLCKRWSLGLMAHNICGPL